MSSDFGISPSAIILKQGEVLLIGHDTSLSWIYPDDPEGDMSRQLGGVFFEFLPMSETEVMAVHELGLMRVNSRGSIIWNVDTDVVEDFTFDASGKVCLRTMGSPSPIVVDPRSGELV